MPYRKISKFFRRNAGLLSSAFLHTFLGILSGLPLLWGNFWENPVLIETPPPIRLSLIRTSASVKKFDTPLPLPQAEPEKAPPTKSVEKKITKKPATIKKKSVSPIQKKQEPVTPSESKAPISTKESKTEVTETQNNQQSSAKQPQSIASVETAESIEYEKALIYLLSKSKRYPERARRRGISGEGIIRLKLNRDGSISKLKIEKSAQSDILDKELIDLVRRVSPLPPVPNGGRTDFLIPVRFSLRD